MIPAGTLIATFVKPLTALQRNRVAAVLDTTMKAVTPNEVRLVYPTLPQSVQQALSVIEDFGGTIVFKGEAQ